MQKTKFTETQIVASIKKQESGVAVTEICRELGIHKATFYNWKAKYGGMTVSELKRVKELEEENARLKRIVANQALELDAVKNVFEKKYGGLPKN